MRWIALFSAACAGAIIAAMLVIWVLNGWADMGLSGSGILAMILGFVLSAGLGVGLMALTFYSNRSHKDDTVRDLGDARAPNGRLDERGMGAP